MRAVSSGVTSLRSGRVSRSLAPNTRFPPGAATTPCTPSPLVDAATFVPVNGCATPVLTQRLGPPAFPARADAGVGDERAPRPQVDAASRTVPHAGPGALNVARRKPPAVHEQDSAPPWVSPPMSSTGFSGSSRRPETTTMLPPDANSRGNAMSTTVAYHSVQAEHEPRNPLACRIARRYDPRRDQTSTGSTHRPGAATSTKERLAIDDPSKRVQRSRGRFSTCDAMRSACSKP